jgi:hypothetical protein
MNEFSKKKIESCMHQHLLVILRIHEVQKQFCRLSVLLHIPPRRGEHTFDTACASIEIGTYYGHNPFKAGQINQNVVPS